MVFSLKLNVTLVDGHGYYLLTWLTIQSKSSSATTIPVNHRYLLRSNEKTISVNTGVIHKKRHKVNPSEEVIPFPSTRVIMKKNEKTIPV